MGSGDTEGGYGDPTAYWLWAVWLRDREVPEAERTFTGSPQAAFLVVLSSPVGL